MCLTLRRSALAVLIAIPLSPSLAFKSVGNDEMPTSSFFSHGIYVVSCPFCDNSVRFKTLGEYAA